MLTAVLFAVTIGSEITSAPIAPTLHFDIAAPAVAMARDERGVVIAWTTDRVNIARLDATGHVEGVVHEIAALPPAVNVEVPPSIARFPNGPGFVVAWLERIGGPSPVRSDFCRLDADLNPRSCQVLAFSQAPQYSSPVVVRSGASMWITSNGVMSQLYADGSTVGVPSGVIASDMASSTDTPIAIGARQNQIVSACSCGGPHDWVCPASCSTYIDTMSIQLVWLYQAAAAREFQFDTSAKPAIQTGTTDALIAWYDGVQSRGGAVVAARIESVIDVARFDKTALHEVVLGTFGSDSGATRPDIATDGERYLVVWRTKAAAGDYDVVGAILDADDKVTFLPIAMSSANERDPSVIFVGAGRFLVAYEKIEGGERRLAGRFIDLGERRHAVH